MGKGTKGDNSFLPVSLCLLFRRRSLPGDFLLHLLGQNVASPKCKEGWEIQYCSFPASIVEEGKEEE